MSFDNNFIKEAKKYNMDKDGWKYLTADHANALVHESQKNPILSMDPVASTIMQVLMIKVGETATNGKKNFKHCFEDGSIGEVKKLPPLVILSLKLKGFDCVSEIEHDPTCENYNIPGEKTRKCSSKCKVFFIIKWKKKK